MSSTPLIVIAGTDAVTNTVRAAVSATADQLSQITQPQGLVVAGPGQWSIQNTPAAGAQATITKPAGGAGVRHVCQGFIVSITGNVNASQFAYLRDGASGAGTVFLVLLPTTTTGAETQSIQLSGLNIIGSPNTAMTLEFIGATAGTNQIVNLIGYSTLS